MHARMQEQGSVAVLNVGKGDLRLSFDPSNPAERKRAAKIMRDMFKRGYAILVQVGEQDGEPLYQRAKAFDPKRCEYLVVGAPEAPPAPQAASSTPARRAARQTRVPAESTRTVAVARSAGG